MGTIINVHSHFLFHEPAPSSWAGNLSHINFSKYLKIIEWLENYISPAQQEYNFIYDGPALGRCGLGWSVHKESFDTKYEWCVEIEDMEMAIIFKLEWS
jgi:hypothetical protein